MTVVDLTAARKRREAALQIAEQHSQMLADLIVGVSLRFAERAFAASSPLAKTDMDIARVVNQGLLRKLKINVRRTLRGDPLLPTALSLVEQVYTGRLLALIEDRNAREAQR